VKKGKTSVLKADEARELLDSIPLKIGPKPKEGEDDNRPPPHRPPRPGRSSPRWFSLLPGSCDGHDAVEDYFVQGRRSWLRLHEKGGKHHEMPCHHNLEEYLDAYVKTAGIEDDKKGPLFRTAPRDRER